MIIERTLEIHKGITKDRIETGEVYRLNTDYWLASDMGIVNLVTGAWKSNAAIVSSALFYHVPEAKLVV